MSNPKGPEVKVRRFSKAFVAAHAINFISFMVLYISALPMYTEFFDWLYPVFGGPENARLVHRIFAVIFCTPTVIWFIFDRKGLFRWFKEIVTWKKRDVEWFKQSGKELTGFKFEHVPQSFFNAGEKINSWIQIVTATLIIVSGFTMWFPAYFPRWAVQWGFFTHSASIGLAIAVVVGHIYMAAVHKHSAPGFKGVVTGIVPAWWAKSHYTDWYNEEVKKGNFPDVPIHGHDDDKKTKGA
ncbi:formate dehydrogenase [Bacillus sp. DNRA2]|uniref:formate dehydrogenase subunit gamma n=1 Tax=Bacillus sp. DNRA2 TaxID=2723053 RepID=UPI00145C77C3|nr:cytochrome b/b6 domain-containing protein [Bacillus sp. DNRA2]NMD72330.1 formate dehydrogenase [Bacillus sp. DNRA2]